MDFSGKVSVGTWKLPKFWTHHNVYVDQMIVKVKGWSNCGFR